MKFMQEMVFPSIDDADGLAKCLEFGEDSIRSLKLQSERDSSCFLTPEDSPIGVMDSEIITTCRNGDTVNGNQESSLRLVPKLKNGIIFFELELNSNGSDTEPDSSSTSPLPPFSDEELQNAAAAIPVKVVPKSKKRLNSAVAASKTDPKMPAKDGTALSATSNKAPRIPKKDLYQEVVKVMKASSKTSLELRSLENNDQLSKALTKVLGNKTVTHKIPGTDSIIVYPSGEEKGEAIGSSENPIQVLQQGNVYYCLHSLREQQLKNLCSVLQDNYNRAKKARNEEKEPTNTKIVYQVVKPNKNGQASCDESRLEAGEEHTQRNAIKPDAKKRRVSWQHLSLEEREVSKMNERRQSLKELCSLCSKEELLSVVLPFITPLLSVWQFVLKKSEDLESGVIEPQSVLSHINSSILELKKVFQSLCRPDTNTESEDSLVNLSEYWETVAIGMHFGKYLVSAEKWIKYTQQQLEDTVCKILDDFQEEDVNYVETPESNVSEKRKYETIGHEPNKRVKSEEIQQEVSDIGKKDEAASNFINGGQMLATNSSGYVLLKVVNGEVEKPHSMQESPVIATLPNHGSGAVNKQKNNAVNRSTTKHSANETNLMAMNEVAKPFRSTKNEQAAKPRSKKGSTARSRKQRKIESKNVPATCITASPIGNLIPVQSKMQNQIGNLIPALNPVENLMSVQGCQRLNSGVSTVAHVQKTDVSVQNCSSSVKQRTASGSSIPDVCVQNGKLSLATRYVTQGARSEGTSFASPDCETGRLSSVLDDAYIPVTCIQQPLVNGVGYILENTFAKSSAGKANERLPTNELTTRKKNIVDNCIGNESEPTQAQVLSPVLISNGSPLHLSRGPPTPLSIEPTASLSIGPNTSLSTEPATPLSIGPNTPLSIGSGTPLSIGPSTPLSIASGTPLSIGPNTPLSIGSGTPLSIGSNTPLSIGSGATLSIVQNSPLSVGSGTSLSLVPNTPLSVGPATPLSVVPSSLEGQSVSNHYLIDVQSLVQAEQNAIVNASRPINGIHDRSSNDALRPNIDRAREKNEGGVPRKRSKTKAKTKKNVSKVQPLIPHTSSCSIGYLNNKCSNVLLGEVVMSKSASWSSAKSNFPGLAGTSNVTFTADAPISTVEVLDTRSTADLNLDAQNMSMFLPNKQTDVGLKKSVDYATQNVIKIPEFVNLEAFLKTSKTKALRNTQPPTNPTANGRLPTTAAACEEMNHESLGGLSSLGCLPPVETHKNLPKALPLEMFSSAAMTEILKAENEPPVKSLSAPLDSSLDDSSLFSISDLLKVDAGSTEHQEPSRTNIIETSVSGDQYPSCTTPSSFTAAIDSMATKGGDFLLTTMSDNTPRLSTPLSTSSQNEETCLIQDDLYPQKLNENCGQVMSKRQMASKLDGDIRVTKNAVRQQQLAPQAIQLANGNCMDQHDKATGLVADPCIVRLKKDILSELFVSDEASLKNDGSRVAIFSGDFSSEDSSTSLFKTLEYNLSGVSDKIDTSSFSSLVNDDSLSALLSGQGSGAEMEVSRTEPSNAVPYWQDNAMIDIEDILTTTS